MISVESVIEKECNGLFFRPFRNATLKVLESFTVINNQKQILRKFDVMKYVKNRQQWLTRQATKEVK